MCDENIETREIVLIASIDKRLIKWNIFFVNIRIPIFVDNHYY